MAPFRQGSLASLVAIFIIRASNLRASRVNLTDETTSVGQADGLKVFQAGVAQLVEHNVANVVVVGSNPITRSEGRACPFCVLCIVRKSQWPDPGWK
jgi:hypothetical protein